MTSSDSGVELYTGLGLLRFMVSRYRAEWPLPSFPFVPAYTCAEPDPPTIAPFLDVLAAFLPSSSKQYCALTLSNTQNEAHIHVAVTGNFHYRQEIRDLLESIWSSMQRAMEDPSFPIVPHLTSTFIKYHFSALKSRFQDENAVIGDFLSYIDNQPFPAELREFLDFTRQILTDSCVLYDKELVLDEQTLMVYATKLQDGLHRTGSVMAGTNSHMKRLFKEFSVKRGLSTFDLFQRLLDLYWPVRRGMTLARFVTKGELALLKHKSLCVSFIPSAELGPTSDRSLDSRGIATIIEKVHHDYCPEVSEIVKNEIRERFMEDTDGIRSNMDSPCSHPETTLILYHLHGPLHSSAYIPPYPYIASSIPCCFACRIFLRAVRVMAAERLGNQFDFATRMIAGREATGNYEGIKDTAKWADWCFPLLPHSLSSTKPLITSVMLDIVYRMISYRLVEHRERMIPSLRLRLQLGSVPQVLEQRFADF